MSATSWPAVLLFLLTRWAGGLLIGHNALQLQVEWEGQRMLPDFLVIGAMKAGTTTLYHDLRQHPNITIPDKELGALEDDGVLSAVGRARYEARYRGAHHASCAGDVSTTYAMLPDRPGCARRARTLLGPDTKIIYLIRNPIERVISHHQHERQEGTITVDVDAAVRSVGRLVAFSQYARQLDPWVDQFGRDQIVVVRLEDYAEARNKTIAMLCSFLDVPVGAVLDQRQVHNRSEAKPVPKGLWRAVHDNMAYRRAIRPLLSAETRARIRHAVLPNSTVSRDIPAPETVEYLIDALADDLQQQQRLLGDVVNAWTPDRLLAEYTR